MLPYRLWKHRLSPGAGVALHVQAKSVYLGSQLRRGKSDFSATLVHLLFSVKFKGRTAPWHFKPLGGNCSFPLRSRSWGGQHWTWQGCFSPSRLYGFSEKQQMPELPAGQTYKEKCPRSKVEPSGRLAPLRTAKHMFPRVFTVSRESKERKLTLISM